MHIHKLDAFLKKTLTKIHFGGCVRFIYLEYWLKKVMVPNIKACFSSVMRTHLEFVIEFGFMTPSLPPLKILSGYLPRNLGWTLIFKQNIIWAVSLVSFPSVEEDFFNPRTTLMSSFTAVSAPVCHFHRPNFLLALKKDTVSCWILFIGSQWVKNWFENLCLEVSKHSPLLLCLSNLFVVFSCWSGWGETLYLEKLISQK